MDISSMQDRCGLRTGKRLHGSQTSGPFTAQRILEEKLTGAEEAGTARNG
jgi:hypothetical protein